jgi:hypothetical protein
MGNVEVAISLVLVETGNVKMTTIGRQEGNIRGGLLDVMKDIASWDVVLTCFAIFPIQPAHVVPMSLAIGDLQQRPWQAATVAPGDFSLIWWCSSSTES